MSQPGTTLYTIAARAPSDKAATLLHTALLEAMEANDETPQYLAGVNVRFFRYADCVRCDHCGDFFDSAEGRETCGCGAILPADETELDIIETTEADFVRHIDKGQAFTYERNTVRENGVSQICLTLKNEDY